MVRFVPLLSICLWLCACTMVMRAQDEAERGLKLVRMKNAQGQTQEINLYDKSYALVIGVSNYTNGWPSLPGVKNDVAAVKAALEKHGFSVDVVKAVDSAGIDKSLSDFLGQYGLHKENRLLIYFAGHGYTLKDSEGVEMGYIVPADAPLPQRDLGSFLAKAMDMQQIDGYAKKIQAKHALFLFDSCFSGSLFEIVRAVPEDISAKTAKPVRQFITSGSADEQVPDRSIFCEQFVAGLEGDADADKDGYITGTELGAFLQKTVVNYSHQMQNPQYGKIRHKALDKGDFVFQTPQVKDMEKSSLQPVEPVTPSISLDEQKKRAEQLRKVKESWQNNLEQMKRLYADCQCLDRSELSEAEKRGNWEKLLQGFSQDNPYSQEDDGIRTQARARVAYWQKEDAKRQHQTPKPSVPQGFIFLHEATYTCNGQSHTVKEYRHNQTGMEFVLIPGGMFAMGSNYGDSNEKPVHTVRVSAFLMSKHETTQAVWQKIIGSTPSKFKGSNRPVEQVSWNDCQSFCQKTGLQLPTEAQWEYACRAGTQTEYYWGNDMDEGYAWYSSNSSSQTHEVGGKSPNAFGLYDMSGNVWEWCQDVYGNYPSREATDPTGVASGSRRVVRGGGWYDGIASRLRSAVRSGGSPARAHYYIGFRVVSPIR